MSRFIDSSLSKNITRFETCDKQNGNLSDTYLIQNDDFDHGTFSFDSVHSVTLFLSKKR